MRSAYTGDGAIEPAFAVVQLSEDDRAYRRTKRKNRCRVPHTWRTRADLFASVWPEIASVLDRSPHSEAKTLFVRLQYSWPRVGNSRGPALGNTHDPDWGIVVALDTPTSSSWLNMVERLFAEITRKRIRRGVFRSVLELNDAIDAFIEEHNQNQKAFKWTKTADDVFSRLAPLYEQNKHY